MIASHYYVCLSLHILCIHARPPKGRMIDYTINRMSAPYANFYYASVSDTINIGTGGMGSTLMFNNAGPTSGITLQINPSNTWMHAQIGNSFTLCKFLFLEKSVLTALCLSHLKYIYMHRVKSSIISRSCLTTPEGLYCITVAYRQNSGNDVWTVFAVTKNGNSNAVRRRRFFYFRNI